MKTRLTLALALALALTFVACQNPVDPSHSHEWNNWEVTRAANCSNTGVQIRYCATDPSHTETATIPTDLAIHAWGDWVATIPATCVATGTGTRTCICGETDPSNVIPVDSNAHDWNGWAVSTPVSITDDGWETATCRHNGTHTGSIRRYAYATGTPGLAFVLIDDNTAYGVSKGTVTSNEVHIPAFWRPEGSSNFDDYKPVTEISNNSNNYNNTAFGGTLNGGYNTTLTAVTFAEGNQLKVIRGHAFYRCQNLTSIEIPASVTTISGEAFYECPSLTTVTIAENSQLNSIGGWAFCSANNLTTIRIPAGVTSIGQQAFNGCKNLVSITIPASVTTLGTSVFAYWTANQTIYVDRYPNEAASTATAANGGWGDWVYSLNAVRKYWNGSRYQ